MPDPTYADFDEAFTEYTNQKAATTVPSIQAALDSIDLAIGEGFSEDGFWFTLDAVWYLQQACFTHMVYGIIDEIYGAHDGALWWAGQAGGDVTLEAINNGMKDGAYLEISDFLSILWAFQQIMWDQPFFPEKYTALINEIRT